MTRDEVDDTEMTPAAFRCALAQGVSTRVVRSRGEYQEALRQQAAFALNVHLDFAYRGTPQSENSTVGIAS